MKISKQSPRFYGSLWGSKLCLYSFDKIFLRDRGDVSGLPQEVE